MTSKSLKQTKHHDQDSPAESSTLESANIKIASDSFMFSSELYYKQLLALGKAAAAGKMCFNSIKIKDSATPINCSISDKAKFNSDNEPEDNEEGEGNNEEDEDDEHDNNNEKAAAFVWSSASEPPHNVAGGGTGSTGHSNKCVPVAGGPTGGGPQGNQAPPQGLVHWMSVMAEHMNNAANNVAHHDAVHYMWNGAVDQCGPHGKDVDYTWSRQSMMKQGYEAKMNTDQQNNNNNNNNQSLQKAIEENGHQTNDAIYNNGTPRSHSTSSNSLSPPAGAQPAMLIVPHPLTSNQKEHHVVTHNGSGRKYQCKMCPSTVS
ncbi:hypothetical protein M8J76_011814 [Diaphorina citri]|nr:hypothetical protein M8J76_011814 [Diaphorina citri]